MVAAVASRSSQEITPDLMIPDLLASHPQARRVFDRYGLRGCGGRLGPVESIEFFARTHGVDLQQLLDELHAAIAVPLTRTDFAPSEENIADTIYRRFFLGGIILILTAGATWGAFLLWQIGFAGKFTGISVHHVNAHGQAQIFGWCGLFIMGFAYQAFPRLWHTDLLKPRLAACVFAAMIAGLLLRTIGMIGAGAWALPTAMLGGAAQIFAVTAFIAQLCITFRRSAARLEPYIGFVLAGLGFFLAMTILDQWHTYKTMAATTREALLWQVATWQAPLRDLQIHGLAMFMIFGVCIRMLPPLLGVPAVKPRRAWRAMWLLLAAVVLEFAIFLVYRYTGKHAIAALLMAPWIMLTIGCWMVAAPFKLWRKPAIDDRSGKFVRAAYAWLAISLVMLLLLPVHQLISGIKFSHAYYGAIRHAITVGFISLMIMGIAAKVVPTLNGIDPRRLPALWGPFILVNVGCFLRCSLQSLTDYDSRFFAVVGISGILEVTGLAWWGVGLARIMLRRQPHEEPAPMARPAQIESSHCVADIVAWFPDTLAVFKTFGFTLLANPILRNTMGRGITVAQAATLRNVCAGDLLRALNQSIGVAVANKHEHHDAECTGSCAHAR